MNKISLLVAVLITVSLAADYAMAQPAATQPTTQRGRRGGGYPTRSPNEPGYVKATELPDGAVPPVNVDGNFILGPTHNPAPEMTVKEGVPKGDTYRFTIKSEDSKIYPGIRRNGPNGNPDPNNPASMIITNSEPAPWQRTVTVYVPKQYVPGTEAPFMVTADGDAMSIPALDNLIHEKRIPPIVLIAIPSGGGDAQGSQRGLEYDNMNGTYAQFVETEVLPIAEKTANVKLTKDPNGRATMGSSSGGSAALIMAWYRNDLYTRVLTFSGTYVNQEWPYNPETHGGAWSFHEKLIPNSPKKNIRIWMEVGDRDNFNPNNMRDDMHDWVLANQRMAKVLAEKGYHYQFVFAKSAGHTDGAVKRQTFPQALEYIWQGYPIPGK